MFACLHAKDSDVLRDVALEFSPRIERTGLDTVILNIAGLDRLFGSAHKIAQALAQRAAERGIKANVAVAANPDAAFHAAQGFAGVTVFEPGQEAAGLASLPVEVLGLTEEVLEILDRWGIHSFGELAGLPPLGVAERLGPEGLRLQQLARGCSDRPLCPDEPEAPFEESLELEHPIELLEPLAFLLARLIEDLCKRLEGRGLAAQELFLRLGLENGSDHVRSLRLAVPMVKPRAFLKLLHLDLSAHPPSAPIKVVNLAVHPAKPRPLQGGLFDPAAPHPEKLEVVLARLAALVGADHVGSPELLDTYRPDAFRMVRFGGATSTSVAASDPLHPPHHQLAFRVFRPAQKIRVSLANGQPVQISGHGKVTAAAGPWRGSGDWWTIQSWDRDEWDVMLADRRLFRIYREQEEWFLQGAYD